MFITRLRIGLCWMHSGLQLGEEMRGDKQTTGVPKRICPPSFKFCQTMRKTRDHGHHGHTAPLRAAHVVFRSRIACESSMRLGPKFRTCDGHQHHQLRWDDFWSCRIICTMVKTWYREVCGKVISSSWGNPRNDWVCLDPYFWGDDPLIYLTLPSSISFYLVLSNSI